MPDFTEEIRKQLTKLRLAPTRENEIVEELSQHLEDQYEQSLSRGASQEEAYQATLRALTENDVLARELKRVERRVVHEPVALGNERAKWLGDLWPDLRYGLRMLAKNPGFTIVAVIALALGIGANSAIFSVVNTVLLRPLPYRNPEQLVMVWEENSKQGFPKDTPAAANYVDWRDQNHVFESIAAMADISFNLTGTGDPERIDGQRVSTSFFPLLGVEPQLGRAFRPEEDKPGANQVAVMSYGLWQRRFGADPGIIGKPISLNGKSFIVVGVMPRSFQFPRNNQLWIPIAFDAKEAGNRGAHYLQVVARIRSGTTLEQAQAEMTTIAARLEKQYPATNTSIGAVVTPLHQQVVGKIRPALLVLLGAVAFVLLIACANVANLLLARAAVRQKEIALRLALGATRSRLIRQFLTESVLLASLGGAVGLLLSLAGLNVLKGFIPPNIPQAGNITIDGKVLIFTMLVSLATGLIFGLAPALQAAHFNLNDTLKESGRDSDAGTRGNRIRGLLVISEVAVSFILLIGAGLLINSFVRLRNVDPGFRAANVLTMRIVLPEVRYPDRKGRAPFYDELIRRVEALPGVMSAAVVTDVPLTNSGNSVGVSIEGRADPAPDRVPIVITRMISPNYFKTMGIPLRQGRELNQGDKADSSPVVVISETTARLFWPGADPLGKRIKVGVGPNNSNQWLSVVGVVKDVRNDELGIEPKPQMYLPHAQNEFFDPRALVVRTNVDPLSLAATVRRTVWEIDKDQPVSDISSMEQVVAESVARQRFSMLLLGVFAGLALVLAAVGIYGVMSYAVAQRTHEIGIRMALGAQRSDVLKLTIGQGLRLVVSGVVIGFAAAFALTRVMASLLFGISPTDSTTFITISLVLISVAALASYIPALRATRVDPMFALRYE